MMLNSCDKSSETSPVLRMYLMKFAQTKDCRNIVVTRTRQVANVSHNMLSFHSVGRKHYNISTNYMMLNKLLEKNNSQQPQRPILAA